MECDAQRRSDFQKKLEKGKSAVMEDEKKINTAMNLIVGVQKKFTEWRKRSLIFAGTLLGWYRQCSLIPYDHDVDVVSWIDDFEPWIQNFFVKNKVGPRIDRVFGRPNDSLEFRMRYPGPWTLDLFWLYRTKDFTWLGIQTFDKKHTKKISIYPPFERICTAELHGYMVYAPCNAEELLKHEYGEKTWNQPKKKYSYASDAKNWRKNGTWTDAEWKNEVFLKF